MTAERPFAAVPAPDADRVSTIRVDLDPARPDTFGAFAEPARESLRSACEALVDDRGGRAADEAAERLSAICDAARGLNPQSLTPRRGLVGLFDSRGRRLKRMREAFLATDQRLAGLAEELGARVSALKARAEALEPRQEALRAPIVELGAWLEAGRQRLADAPDDGSEGEASPRRQLSDRLERLAAGRVAALGQLPLVRILQNADASAAQRLEGAAAAVQAWRDDWRKALGLEGKRRRKVQPEPSTLASLTDRLDATARRARAALDEGRQRRARVAERLDELNRSLGDPPSAE